MPDKWPLANGNWSNAANWNGGTKPVAGDDVFADGRSLNVDENFTVATLRNTQRSGGTLGGSFVFNTSGVTGNATSSTPLFQAGTNLIQVTATTGTVTITLGGAVVALAANPSNTILHSGNCNFTLNGVSFQGGIGLNNSICINKTSTGDMIIGGNISGGGNANCPGVNVSAGNCTINGSVTGGVNNATTNNGVIFSGTGNTLTINGSVTGNTFSAGVSTISNVTINGSVIGGTVANALVTSAPINNITGNVTAGTVAAISSTSANIINVTGTVTASASAPAISMTNANGQVYLNGNMVNNNGKMAIFAPIVWLDKNNTTSAAFFTSGGGNRTLYSADTVPNTPAVNNVRQGTVFGAGNSLTGTIQMPVAADVRNGVVYDNGTVGTALFTTSLFLTEINASSDAIAVRMKNAATPQILGELMEAFKK